MKLLFRNLLQTSLVCIFQCTLLQRCPKCWNFSMFGWISTSSGAHTAYSLNFGMDKGSFLGFAICICSKIYFWLYHKSLQVALFHWKCILHVTPPYSRYKWYYKTPQGQFFIQMIRERTDGDTISAIAQRALSLIQAGKLVEYRDFQWKRLSREGKYQTKPHRKISARRNESVNPELIQALDKPSSINTGNKADALIVRRLTHLKLSESDRRT